MTYEHLNELLKAGRLGAAIEQCTQAVKASPADTNRRRVLFYLLCFMGEYQRAEQQLAVIEVQDASAAIDVTAYKKLLEAEVVRAQLFTKGVWPAFLSGIPDYVEIHLEAVCCLQGQRFEEAKNLVEKASEIRPAFSGELNGQRFEDFQDSDDLLGPVLETIVAGRYTWIPLEQVKSLSISTPTTLSDSLWVAALMVLRNGMEVEVFVPVRYIGSHTSDDERIRLGRATNWQLVGGRELIRGLGQRRFFADTAEYALLDVRTLTFDG